MKWTVTLVAETEPGHVTEHPLAQVERADTITPASLGLSIAEGKTPCGGAPDRDRHRASGAARQGAPTVPSLRSPADDERLLHLDLSFGLWPGADARAPTPPLPV